LTTSTESNLDLETVTEEQDENEVVCQVAMKRVMTGQLLWYCGKPAGYIVHMHTNANSPTLEHRESSNFMCHDCLTHTQLAHDVCMMHNVPVIMSVTSIR
jgi:hypothetical protein